MNLQNKNCLIEHEDYFCWILDKAMPWSGGRAVVLQAYCDASERGDEIFCVAGFAFDEERAKKATRQWISLWGDTRCHMTDLNARKGAFKGWTPEQTSKRLEDSVPIINSCRSYGIAVSCNISEFKRSAPKESDSNSKKLWYGFKTPYALCTHLAMTWFGLMQEENNGIAYFFEKGDRYQGESKSFIDFMISNNPAHEKTYKLRSHTFLRKEDCRLLEMSDIFAWEWTKQIDRNVNNMPIRGSLKAMLGKGVWHEENISFLSKNIFAFHLNGEKISGFFNKAKEMELFSDNPSPEALMRMASYFQ